MADRSRRLLAGVALSALAALPLAGVAQTQKYYHPPKILALGTHAMIPEALHQGGSLVVLPTVAGFLFALWLALGQSFV